LPYSEPDIERRIMRQLLCRGQPTNASISNRGQSRQVEKSAIGRCHGKAADGSKDMITMRGIFILVLCLGIPIFTMPVRADQIGLSPPDSRVEIRTYGLGLLPLDGNFTRFHGWMHYQPSTPTACQVILEIEASSLAMGSDAIRAQITGPEFMDAAQFPDLAFHGACGGDAIEGNLTLHGQTHPFSLELERSPHGIVATGRLKRSEWGITAHPLMGGSTIRIRVEIPDPFAGSHT
jgi:polyisoprenoid-binding protein YceI